MIRWMCGYSRLDRIRNEVIKDLIKVGPIDDKMRESRLQWFGHVKRRSVDAPVRRCKRINIPKAKEGGVDQKRVVGLSENVTQDRNRWRDRIRILNRSGVAS